MEGLSIFFVFFMFNGFWIGSLVRYLRHPNDYLGKFILQYFGCLGVCFVLGCIIMAASNGCHGKLCELEYFLGALVLDAIIYFIWSVAAFVRSYEHIKETNEEKPKKMKGGSIDLLDDGLL